MSKLPLPFVIPFVAVLAVAVIGVGFGVLFLELHEMFNANVTLIVASTITALIMLGAVLLSMRPETGDPETVRETKDASGRPQMGKHTSR